MASSSGRKQEDPRIFINRKLGKLPPDNRKLTIVISGHTFGLKDQRCFVHFKVSNGLAGSHQCPEGDRWHVHARCDRKSSLLLKTRLGEERELDPCNKSSSNSGRES